MVEAIQDNMEKLVKVIDIHGLFDLKKQLGTIPAASFASGGLDAGGRDLIPSIPLLNYPDKNKKKKRKYVIVKAEEEEEEEGELKSKYGLVPPKPRHKKRKVKNGVRS